MTGLVVVGTGGMGREAAAWVADAGRADDVLGFIDDDRTKIGTDIAGLPVLGDRSWLDDRPGVEVVLGIGAPGVRADVIRELSESGVPLASIVHPSAIVGPRTWIGDGAILCPGVVVTCDVTIGVGAVLNFGALVGHDVSVGDAAFLAPGVRIAGAVRIGPRADLGIGCSVIQGLRIGADAVVGAGAVVIRDVPPGATVVGVPAAAVHGSRGAAGRT